MKPPTEMTDEELRVAVALKCGWSANECTSGGLPGYVAIRPDGTTLWRDMGGITRDGAIRNSCPDYPNDLNACAEFERTLDYKTADIAGQTQKQRYRYQLDMLTNFDSAFATARQRCIAFLSIK